MLIDCPICSGRVSAAAAACPHCGEPHPIVKFVMKFEGQSREVTISKIEDYGAFAKINPEGFEGLIHVSRISEKRISHPSEVLRVGQTVRVKILGADPRGKAILSMTPTR